MSKTEQLKERHIPERRCAACRTRRPKNELLRFVPDGGKAVMDKSKKTLARGAYLCDDIKCIALALKKKSIGRQLGVSAEEALSDALNERAGR